MFLQSGEKLSCTVRWSTLQDYVKSLNDCSIAIQNYSFTRQKASMYLDPRYTPTYLLKMIFDTKQVMNEEV